MIAEIETDKATMEVEAVDEGVIGKLLIDAGTEGVKVNTPIAVLIEEGESAADISSSAKKEEPKAEAANSDLMPQAARPAKHPRSRALPRKPQRFRQHLRSKSLPIRIFLKARKW